MEVPLVCFITFNRLGLTVHNLKALLRSTDDFDLYIIDNNSTDDTWKFICEVKDIRIKLKKRFEVNYGVVYAINYALSMRKKNQYFILIENDVYIETKDFVTKFMEVMSNFKEVGLLGGVRDKLFEDKNISPQLHSRNGVSYHKYSTVLGCCNCIRPEVFEYIGYWNEETYGADIDMGIRINNYTPFVTGYVSSVSLKQSQYISCDKCLYREQCTLDKKKDTCFNIHKKNYSHGDFAILLNDKQKIYFQQLKNSVRSIYCASIHDSKSIKEHYYDQKMASDNFQFFLENGN